MAQERRASNTVHCVPPFHFINQRLRWSMPAKDSRLFENPVYSVCNLRFLRESASFELRIHEVAVDAHLECTSARWNKVDVFQFIPILIRQRLRQTGGFRTIASRCAVLYFYLHVLSPLSIMGTWTTRPQPSPGISSIQSETDIWQATVKAYPTSKACWEYPAENNNTRNGRNCQLQTGCRGTWSLLVEPRVGSSSTPCLGEGRWGSRAAD